MVHARHLFTSESVTEGHPDKQVFVHMEPNDESVNKEKIANEKIDVKYG